MSWPVPFNKKAETLIKARSGGVCEGCWKAEATQMHHRRFRGRGGRGNPANGLHLCGFGNHNNGGCHGVAHAGYIGESLGWAIRSGHDPEKIPTFRKSDNTWWLFDNDGGKVRVHPVDAVEYMTLIGAIRTGANFAY